MSAYATHGSQKDMTGRVWQAAPPPLLRDGAVHVWRLRPDLHPLEDAWPLLSLAERERAARFQFEHHRRFYVATRALMRRVLSQYVETPPERLTFTEGAAGKPSLATLARPEFNLSHSGELALLAVSSRAVGIDVERWSESSDLLTVAERFFSATEQRTLRALAQRDEDVRAGFFAAWSRKEAYLKASGVGITQGLDHFAMSLAPDEPACLLLDERDAGAVERWFVTALDVAPGYSAALVAERPVREIVLLDYSR